MTPKRCELICVDRLYDWRKRLVAEHATPVLLLGVGHDHKSGDLVLCCTEDMSNTDLRALLVGAIRELDRQ